MIKDDFNRFFYDDGVDDDFLNIMKNAKSPSFIDIDTFEELIKDSRNILAEYIYLCNTIVAQYSKISGSSMRFVNKAIVEYLFKLKDNFQSNIQDIIDGYVDYEKYETREAYIKEQVKNNNIGKEDTLFIFLLEDTTASEIYNSLATRIYRVKTILDQEYYFAIENKEGDIVLKTNINIQGDNGYINLRYYFLLELLTLLLSTESLAELIIIGYDKTKKDQCVLDDFNGMKNFIDTFLETTMKE